jgi:hypothetical protein
MEHERQRSRQEALDRTTPDPNSGLRRALGRDPDTGRLYYAFRGEEGEEWLEELAAEPRSWWDSDGPAGVAEWYPFPLAGGEANGNSRLAATA